LTGPFYGGELARNPANAPRPLFMTQQTGFRGARLFTLDPATGDLTFSPEIPQGFTLYDRGDLAVVDFDHDGTDEAFIALADIQQPAVGVYDFFAGQLTFRSPPTPPGRGVVDVDYGDIDDDGRDDLVALTSDGLLLAYDALTGAELWSEQIAPGGQAVVVADLNGNGPPEIIAATWGQAVVYSRANASAPFVRTYESVTYPYTGDLTAGDVDGDGRVEIFFVYSGGSPSVQRFNERLELVSSFALEDWAPSSLSIERSASNRKNLVATVPVPEGSQLRVVDPVLGEEIWRSPTIQGYFAPNSVHFVDVDGDGNLAIAYGTFSGVFLTR
jgi:outer membrane protein assembly factor BamB